MKSRMSLFIDDGAAPIQDGYGNILGVILIFRDITPRRITEAALEKTLMRTQDLYQVSHQIGLADTPQAILEALLQSDSIGSIHQAAIITFTEAWSNIQTTTYEIMATSPHDKQLVGFSGKGLLIEASLGQLFTIEKTVYVADISGYAPIPESLREQFYRVGIYANALIPLIANNSCFGMLVLYCSNPLGWNADDLRHIEIFSEQIAVSIQNIHLLAAEAKARQEAEQSNQLKIQFLGMISHELRTPLTSIKGFTTTLLSPERSWDAANQKSFLSVIDEETDKLSDLIDQLLNLAQLTAGRLRVQIERCQMSDIMTILNAQLETLTGDHSLILELPADLPSIMVDAKRIAQVIGNLLGNAAKYSPLNTIIRLSARPVNTMLEVIVSDEGYGIKPEDRLSVFEAFYQLNYSTNSSKKGAGLGLAICKGLIEAHHGQIWIIDRPEPGTSIAFTVPQALEESIRPSVQR